MTALWNVVSTMTPAGVISHWTLKVSRSLVDRSEHKLVDSLDGNMSMRLSTR